MTILRFASIRAIAALGCSNGPACILMKMWLEEARKAAREATPA